MYTTAYPINVYEVFVGSKLYNCTACVHQIFVNVGHIYSSILGILWIVYMSNQNLLIKLAHLVVSSRKVVCNKKK